MRRHPAREYLREVDRGRAEFVKQFFRRDIADPQLYDLIINVERFDPDITADAIVRATGYRSSSVAQEANRTPKFQDRRVWTN